MAHKRLLIYAVLLAICYLVGVTWAETAIQNQASPGSGILSTSNSSNQSNLPASAGATPKPNPSALPPPAASVTSNLGKSSNSSTTTTASPAPDCVCAGALLPHLDANGKELPICNECKCSHVARNTTLIKVVVIIVIWIISILVIYMLFLMCLDPLLNKRVKANYQEHTNEDDEPTPPMPAASTSANNQELSARANVLNRVGHQQDKWKRQVREQRRHIYDRHTMLN
ncbi:uncharacterized protein CG1161 [Drosophila tropicalis]|uniref:uncharacterized protein CG1161 n=1 Tax=Drosophila tropicalis TaxID=46794 RepID=UPI0035AC03EF